MSALSFPNSLFCPESLEEEPALDKLYHQSNPVKPLKRPRTEQNNQPLTTGHTFISQEFFNKHMRQLEKSEFFLTASNAPVEPPQKRSKIYPGRWTESQEALLASSAEKHRDEKGEIDFAKVVEDLKEHGREVSISVAKNRHACLPLNKRITVITVKKKQSLTAAEKIKVVVGLDQQDPRFWTGKQKKCLIESAKKHNGSGKAKWKKVCEDLQKKGKDIDPKWAAEKHRKVSKEYGIVPKRPSKKA